MQPDESIGQSIKKKMLNWYHENWPGNDRVVIWTRLNAYSEYVTVYDKLAWRYLYWNHWHDYSFLLWKNPLHKDLILLWKIVRENSAHYADIKEIYERIS